MSLKSLTAAILTKLATDGVKNPIPPSKWTNTPSGAYTLVKSDPGWARPTGYDAASSRVTIRWQVMSCSNSHDGTLDMSQDVRNSLTDFSPGGTLESGRLTEEFAGPVIEVEGAPLDVRYSQTLNYIMTTHRGEV